MGTLIPTFKKCWPPPPDPKPQSVYPGPFSINGNESGSELYEVVDIPEWGDTRSRPQYIPDVNLN